MCKTHSVCVTFPQVVRIRDSDRKWDPVASSAEGGYKAIFLERILMTAYIAKRQHQEAVRHRIKGGGPDSVL